MNDVIIEQARYLREDTGAPRLAGRSPGFLEEWLPLAQRLVIGFGNRPLGQACPNAVFARPLDADHVAVVQVADRPLGDGGAPSLGFHLLIVAKEDYEAFVGDPFWLARTFPASWNQHTALASLTSARVPPQPRSVSDVQKVLSRVKAGALKDDEDPETAHVGRTADNSESPALLGGVQVLVEGGKLVFERPAPDNELLEGLWTLLPNKTRARLWPASFAFANTLSFDALVVPRLHRADFEGYTSEEQAAEYPQGHYELTLQVAAETSDQRQLDQLLNRRSTRETIRLAWALLLVVALLALTPKVLDWVFPPAVSNVPERAAAAAGVLGAGDPWTALGIFIHGNKLFGTRTAP